MEATLKVLEYDIRATDADSGAWNETALGISCLARQEIRLVPGLPTTLANTTLIHEVIHIIDEIQHVGLSEQDVCNLTAGIYSFIMNNRGVVEDIMGGEPCS